MVQSANYTRNNGTVSQLYKKQWYSQPIGQKQWYSQPIIAIILRFRAMALKRVLIDRVSFSIVYMEKKHKTMHEKLKHFVTDSLSRIVKCFSIAMQSLFIFPRRPFNLFFFFLSGNNQQGNFFKLLKLSKTESFSSSGEILLKNTDLHARSLYPIYSLFYFIVFHYWFKSISLNHSIGLNQSQSPFNLLSN